MKLGIMVEGQEGLTWERWRSVTASAERLGFESLWRSDHFMSLVDPARESLETWVSLTLAAAETERVRLGPLVSPMTFRRPSLLARMAAAVDTLSDGRLVLGVGAGWNDIEHRTFGVAYPSFRERLALLVEGIEVITRLFDEEPASFAGKHVRLDGAQMHPRPERGRPPLLIGGRGGQVLEVVARYADEWNMTGATPDEFRAAHARLAACCRAAGRDPEVIARSVMTGFLIWRDADEFERRCRAMQRLFPAITGLSLDAVPAAVRRWGWVTGTPEEVASYLKKLEAAGVQRVMLQHHDLTDTEVLETIARDILPAVAE